jgi:hypothetical protein
MDKKKWGSISEKLTDLLSGTKYQSKIKLFKNGSILLTIVIIGMIISSLLLVGLFRFATAPAREKAEMIEECGCESIDECVSNYNIDCAWKMYNEYQNDYTFTQHDVLIKLVKAEGAQSIRNKNFDEGWLKINQYDFDSNQEILWAYKYEYINSVIDDFISEGNLNTAKLWAMKASDEHNSGGFKKGHWEFSSTDKTQRELLLEKINLFK